MRLLALRLMLGLCFAGAANANGVVPIANAGPDIAIACVGPNGTPIAMTGLGSSVGPDFSYLWSADPAVVFDDATILGPVGTFAVGTTRVRLTVTYTNPATGAQRQAHDSLYVVVNDPIAPRICACADPALLWPPNHQLHDVHVRIRVYDRCDANPDVELLSVFSNEPDNGLGDGNTTDDIQGAELGTDDRDFAVRAERSGRGDGRIYSATYRAWDLGENHADATVIVAVPHDRRDRGDLLDDDGCHDLDDEIKHETKDAKKAEKAQLKAAKQAAKATKRAYKAALRATR